MRDIEAQTAGIVDIDQPGAEGLNRIVSDYDIDVRPDQPRHSGPRL